MSDSKGRSWLGVAFIIIGALFLLRNFHIVPYEIERLIFSFPAIILIIGIFILINSRNNFMGVLLTAVGGTILALRFFRYSFHDFFYEFWPVMLILFGLYIIYRRKDIVSRKPHDHIEQEDGETTETADDYIDETSAFSKIKKRIKSQNFRGGKTTAIFGGIDLDLYSAQLADGEHTLDMVCIFGGTDIYVPKDWQVIVKATAIFGGIDDKRRQDSGTVYQEGKVLIIKGLALFGGGEIKN